jgi:hypothetical protein
VSRTECSPAKVKNVLWTDSLRVFRLPVPRLRCSSSPSPSSSLRCQSLVQRRKAQLRHPTAHLTGRMIPPGSRGSRYRRVFSASPIQTLRAVASSLVPSPPSLSLHTRYPASSPPLRFSNVLPFLPLESPLLTDLSSFPTHAGVSPRV